MRFQVPQFIEHEAKVIGPLTFRQFIYLGIPAAIGFFLYFLAPFSVFLVVTVFTVGIGAILAFFKVEEAAQQLLPTKGTVLITVTTRDRPAVSEVAKQFKELGFGIKATQGTHRFLSDQGINSDLALKMHEGRPNILDAVKNGEIHLIINTPSGKLSQYDDSYIRKAAIQYKVPYITTLTAAAAAAKGIAAYRRGKAGVKALQDYHADIK